MRLWFPYANHALSAHVLSASHLMQARDSTLRIIAMLGRRDTRHSRAMNHPWLWLWRGHERNLVLYLNCLFTEWHRRGYGPEGEIVRTAQDGRKYSCHRSWWNHSPDPPLWLGWPTLHSRHRSMLLHVDYEWYQQFCWVELPAPLEIWPHPFPLAGEVFERDGRRVIVMEDPLLRQRWIRCWDPLAGCELEIDMRRIHINEWRRVPLQSGPELREATEPARGQRRRSPR